MRGACLWEFEMQCLYVALVIVGVPLRKVAVRSASGGLTEVYVP